MAILNITSNEQINVRYSDIDFDKKLKLFSMLNFFQDIASENAEKLGFGYSYIYPKNLMWVLLKYRIEFENYPTGVQTLTLKTEPRGCNRLFAYRNFEIFSKNALQVKASSMWTLVDFSNMQMVNAENVLSDNEFMGKFTPSENDLKFGKIPNLTNVDFEETFKVRYNDVDVNMHANNANYVVWALEPLPYEFRAQNTLKAVDMHFKKEIKVGETLTCSVQKLDGNRTLHVLRNSANDDLCHVMCEWV